MSNKETDSNPAVWTGPTILVDVAWCENGTRKSTPFHPLVYHISFPIIQWPFIWGRAIPISGLIHIISKSYDIWSHVIIWSYNRVISIISPRYPWHIIPLILWFIISEPYPWYSHTNPSYFHDISIIFPMPLVYCLCWFHSHKTHPFPHRRAALES